MTSSSKSYAWVKLSEKNSVELNASANRLVFQLWSFSRLTVRLATSRAHEFLSKQSKLLFPCPCAITLKVILTFQMRHLDALYDRQSVINTKLGLQQVYVTGNLIFRSFFSSFRIFKCTYQLEPPVIITDK